MQQLNCPVESHTHIFLPAACPLLAASCVTAMPRMPWGPADSPIPCGTHPTRPISLLPAGLYMLEPIMRCLEGYEPLSLHADNEVGIAHPR